MFLTRQAAAETGWLLAGLVCGWFVWIVALTINDESIDNYFATHGGVGPATSFLNTDLMPVIVLAPVLVISVIRLARRRLTPAH